MGELVVLAACLINSEFGKSTVHPPQVVENSLDEQIRNLILIIRVSALSCYSVFNAHKTNLRDRHVKPKNNNGIINIYGVEEILKRNTN